MSLSVEVSRGILRRLLTRIESGRLTVTEGGERTSFGPADADLHAEVTINDPRAWTKIVRGSSGWGESYADGLWDADDLLAACRIAAREIPRLDRPRAALQPLIGPLQRAARLVPRNTRPGARRNVAAHYDLGNELFETFLDPRLVYSCARFPSADASLADAQLAKLDCICRRLDLGPDDHLVEIGSGWGGLAIHAAGEYGCRVTATTISDAQRGYAIERVRDAGLADRIDVIGVDYRDLRGRFDKLVSVEMIEAVGWQFFPLFFRRCSELLRDDGLMLLQAIVVDDRAYEIEKGRKSFANTLIFPGGCLPSRRLIADEVAAETDMRAVWSEDITPHYARTLRAWCERFDAAFERLRSSRYDERFRRLWRLYLIVSEAGFRERRLGDVQLLLAKPRWSPREVPQAEPAATLVAA